MSQLKTIPSWIALALAVVGIPAAAVAKDEKPWALSVQAGLSYDNNITVDQTDISSNVGDSAGVFEASADYKLIDNDITELDVGYDFSQSVHHDLSNFDIQTHQFSVSGSRKLGDTDLDATYSFYHLLLGGNDFLDMHMINPSISGFLAPQIYVRGSYFFFDKSFKTANLRDASNHQPGAEIYYFFDDSKAYFSLGGRYEIEDAVGPEFDYNGFALKASLRLPLYVTAQPGKVNFAYSYSKRDYDNITPSIGARRREDRNIFSAKGEVPVIDALTFILEYRFINRNSNMPSADYNENVITGALKYEF